MIEHTHEIPTADGPMTTFVVRPERDGPHPVILFFMDAPAIREELRDMARRLATVGYYVMLPNLYHREGVMEIGDLNDEATRERMVGLMNGLTIPMVMADSDALLAFADQDPMAGKGPAGCLGYCMSGQFSINAAARHPEKIAAAASLYGTYLVTDKDDSPHKVAHQTQAELYFACAETDRWAPLETVRALAEALEPRAAPTELELYPGTSHGFAFPQRAAYDKAAAERHWERLITLFRRNLG
ncbi:dienelactone hydrolase family protein [Phenylobacterium sp.]|uniref:dienelactone hydrolase family protein n=1 Tax=Phenylobacterium sp. TaxID=1871053 RepID=UPI00272F54D0|nr:dienelactone hydrolase family protein [Phenylobacterium sp.]MDP2215099.1 dienelactone hydrolase family protein [Phenylobacterium sp.]